MSISEMNEQQLRDFKCSSPASLAELGEIIQSLTNREHDYGTCVYAMSIAAEAAFNYVAHKLGVSGFQASCADLDFLRRTRGIKGPFAIQTYGDLLYPQYMNSEKYPGAMDVIAKHADWFREQAGKLLAKKDRFVHQDVVAHWQWLASLPPQDVERGGA